MPKGKLLSSRMFSDGMELEVRAVLAPGGVLPYPAGSVDHYEWALYPDHRLEYEVVRGERMIVRKAPIATGSADSGRRAEDDGILAWDKLSPSQQRVQQAQDELERRSLGAPGPALFAMSTTMGREAMPVASVEDARRKWIEFRDRSDEGVSEIGNGVRVVDRDGTVVASISYNGRVWGPDGKPYRAGARQLAAPHKRKLPHNSPTIPARQFITGKIRMLMRDGKRQVVAIAEALNMARRAGYRSVPSNPKKRH